MPGIGEADSHSGYEPGDPDNARTFGHHAGVALRGNLILTIAEDRSVRATKDNGAK